MPIAEFPGCRLNYTVAGTGRPDLVFVHGGASNHRNWVNQLESLSSDHGVLAFDLRGHGGSVTDDPQTCTIPEGAADVGRMTELVGFGPTVVVGHSLGTRIAIAAAVKRPEQIVGVVLVDGSRGWRVDAADIERTLTERFHDPREATYKIREGNFAANAEPAFKAKLNAMVGETDLASLTAIIASVVKWDSLHMEHELSKVAVPVLAIQSTYWDDDTPRRSLDPETTTTPYLDLLRDHVADLRTVIVPGRGHYVQLEDPVVVNEAIRSFVRKL